MGKLQGTRRGGTTGDRKVMDTLTLAREEREQQGTFEMEVSYGDEVDLHRHYVACDKNPGHSRFLPVDEFSLDDLPVHCRKECILDFVRALSDLTIRVSVKAISDKRPKTYPDSDKPYPYSSTRGNDMKMMRVGSGWLFNVYKCPDAYGNVKVCTCHECLLSKTPKTRFAHIFIFTAAHVVYDDLEAAHTTCHLFFDKGSKPEECEGVVTLSGLKSVRCNLMKDFSRMTYVTHDMDLAYRLAGIVDRWMDLHLSLRGLQVTPESFRSVLASSEEDGHDRSERLTIIVSHPHGCSKQISLGYCTNIHELEDGYTQYTYTTDTCPGSSGAPVFLLGRCWRFVWSFVHVHCGNCEEDRKLNFSGYALDEMPP